MIPDQSTSPPGEVEAKNWVWIYTDGACRGNPGPGGWAAILHYHQHLREISGGEDSTTNNRMELTAVIKALDLLKRPMDVKVFSDSQYVVLGITQWIFDWRRRNWQRKTGRLENRELWMKLDKLNQKHRIIWKWVRGHSNDSMNDRVDRLAKEAIPTLVRR